MKRTFKKRWYLFIPLIVLAFVAFGFVTMYLWNWLMPLLFHLPEITFWQTIGLLLLSRILLGGFGGHGRDHSKRYQLLHEKWKKMTPEERERFKEHIHSHRPPWVNRWCKSDNEKEA